jgi:uncharacterized membrane protein YgaE (UPF0421/DUF939 family)
MWTLELLVRIARFFTVALGTFVAFLVSFFPRLIEFQWHPLKLHLHGFIFR